jgi:hypothetical protein
MKGAAMPGFNFPPGLHINYRAQVIAVAVVVLLAIGAWLHAVL